MSTCVPRPGEIVRNWHVVDAEDVILGHLASQVATLLRGRHKPTYAPHIGGSDFVIVVSAPKITLTGNKHTDNVRYSHSGRPGGLKAISIGELLEKNSRKTVERTVWGMLPKNKLSHRLIGRLRVYPGPERPHTAQKPQPFEITQTAQ